jgi:hypothetical protein
MSNKCEKIHHKFLQDIQSKKRLSPLRAIRCHCLECMGYQTGEIKDCCGDET